MERLAIIPFEPEHFLGMIPREEYRTIAPGLPNDAECAEMFVKRGEACTVTWDGVPVVCAGIVRVWPGLGEAWARWSAVAEAHGGIIHRVLYRTLREAMVAYSYRRVHATIPKEASQSFLWARRLGFKACAWLQDYGPAGEEYVLMALLIRDL